MLLSMRCPLVSHLGVARYYQSRVEKFSHRMTQVTFRPTQTIFMTKPGIWRTSSTRQVVFFVDYTKDSFLVCACLVFPWLTVNGSGRRHTVRGVSVAIKLCNAVLLSRVSGIYTFLCPPLFLRYGQCSFSVILLSHSGKVWTFFATPKLNSYGWILNWCCTQRSWKLEWSWK